jgi:hypothetical protein
MGCFIYSILRNLKRIRNKPVHRDEWDRLNVDLQGLEMKLTGPNRISLTIMNGRSRGCLRKAWLARWA